MEGNTNDDSAAAVPLAPLRKVPPPEGWPKPKKKAPKGKGSWDRYFTGEDGQEGRWIHPSDMRTMPPAGLVTDDCPRCRDINDRRKSHNYGDRCEERWVDLSARCVRCDRECPRKAKTEPDENVCPACKRLVTNEVKFAALEPKREAQARARVAEGFDDEGGRTIHARGFSETALRWTVPTPDQPDKTLVECLEVHLDAADASGTDYGSVIGEATELLRRLKKSNPQSFADGVDYTGAVESQVHLLRGARGRITNKPLSPYGCAGFEVWLTDFERLAQVSCDACSGPIIDFGVISVLVLFLISHHALAFLTLHLECFCRALRNEKPDNREGAAGPESTRKMLLQDNLTRLNSRNAPLWLFRGVLLVGLCICGDANYFYRTFMMTGSAPGLRLPFYKCMHAVNVMMLSSRGFSALYHAYADCVFGRMASRRAIFFAPNVKEEDEGTVGHNFLWSLYPSGAELRNLVSRIVPGVRAQILVRPRLGEIVVFEWDGSDDGIYLRLWRLRRDESLAPN